VPTWFYILVLILPAAIIGRCLHGLLTKQPCRGTCAAALTTVFMLVLIWPRLAVILGDLNIPETLALPEDLSFLEGAGGTLLMAVGIFSVALGLLYLLARLVRR